MREITSEQNSFFRQLRRLNRSTEIRKQRRFLLGGSRLIREIQADPIKAQLEAWIYQAGQAIPAPVSHPTYVLSAELFRQLDFQQVGSPLALLRLPTMPPWDGRLPAGLTLFLPFQDPVNIGTTLRSAAAFGVLNIVLLAGAALPFLPKAARGAGSALFQLNFFSGPTLKELLSQKNDNLFLLDIQGGDVALCRKPDAMGLVAGLEGSGFVGCNTSLHQSLSIPISPTQNSLNAAVAVSIALYVLRY